MTSRYQIDRIKISKTNLSKTVCFLNDCINNKKYGYVCVTNSRTSFLANRDLDYCHIQNNSLLTVPDGIPLVWIAKNNGYEEVGKVSGKDLMDAIFKKSVKNGYSHFFYGCSKDTIKLMKSKLLAKYPKLYIKAAISPPFQPLEDYDIKSLANDINKLNPTFFWCGLGAPKQEYIISLLQPHLKSTICVGVGLAFEYFAGTVKRVPILMQKSGLEWLYRLSQQPKKIKRAIKPLSWIFIKLLKSKI